MSKKSNRKVALQDKQVTSTKAKQVKGGMLACAPAAPTTQMRKSGGDPNAASFSWGMVGGN